jgi:hypothetical protein
MLRLCGKDFLIVGQLVTCRSYGLGMMLTYFAAAILSQTCQKAFISSGWPKETRA